MNEQIRQLAEQAEIKFDAHPSHLGIDTAVIIPADLQKFAELIEEAAEKKYFSAGYIAGRSDGTIETVRECAKFLDENSGYDEFNNSWHPEPEDMLKHFGVEK